MQKVITNLISSDQGGYIKKRFIGFNARLITDLIEYYENKNLNGAIICLDFEKAYDSFDWNFLKASLKNLDLEISL